MPKHRHSTLSLISPQKKKKKKTNVIINIQTDT